MVTDPSHDKILVENVRKLTVLRDAEVKFDRMLLFQYLQAFFIQHTHRAIYFLSIDDILWLHKMVWALGISVATGMYYKKNQCQKCGRGYTSCRVGEWHLLTSWKGWLMY